MLGVEPTPLSYAQGGEMSDHEKDEQQDAQQDEQRDEQPSTEVEDLDVTAEESADVKGSFHFVQRINKTSPL